MKALIGWTGYVGTTLARQTRFDVAYRSTTIAEADHRHFDLMVCAGAPGAKWRANAHPEDDARSIDDLITHLATVSAERFVLISTVDVFADPRQVDERTTVSTNGLQPYGLNRRRLEEFVLDRFPHALVVRLPGLVGPGLRKNVIYDLRHDNALDAVDSRSVFQFYPMVNLWADLESALTAGLSLLHLTAAPISVADVAEKGFGRGFAQRLDRPVAAYDLRTVHAEELGGHGSYTYSARDSLMAIRAYAQSEPRSSSNRPAIDLARPAAVLSS